MKKSLLITLALLATSTFLFAGGILTNTNQSARYIRLLANDASLGIDAVYYNPAGLTFLPEGLHLSVNNQSIFQNKEIRNSYAFLNHNTYKGNITAPLFPGIYAAYRTGKFAFSLGFNPIGGGGSAEYKEGLPSFETSISELPVRLGPLGYDDTYSGDFYFSGMSVFWGLQFGVTYETCDYFSLYLGGRYIMAKNTYEGHIKDVSLYSLVSQEFQMATDIVGGLSLDLTNTAGSISQLVAAGAGTLTAAQAAGAGYITAEDQAKIEAGLQTLGYAAETPLETSQMIFEQAGAEYGAQAQLLDDQDVEAQEVGTGFSPIFGANIFLLDKKLNIGIKYEMKAEIELENETEMDFLTGFEDDGTPITMFPDGAKKRSDMPAMLSLGASYKLGEKLNLNAGYHLYWDTEVDWDGKEEKIDDNYWEFAAGLEYQITDNVWISAGYLYAASGVSVGYQTDMSYSLSSNTVGFGGKFKVQDNVHINLGMLYTGYETGEQFRNYTLDTNVKETYYKNNLIFSIGADIQLF